MGSWKVVKGEGFEIHPVLSHTFLCSSCGAAAETIVLVPAGTPYRYGGSPAPWVMVRAPRGGSIVFNEGSEAVALDPAAFLLARKALEEGDARRLHRLQPLWVARYCLPPAAKRGRHVAARRPAPKMTEARET